MQYDKSVGQKIIHQNLRMANQRHCCPICQTTHKLADYGSQKTKSAKLSCQNLYCIVVRLVVYVCIVCFKVICSDNFEKLKTWHVDG